MALFRRNKTIQLNADAVAKYSDKVAQIPDDLMARCPKCHKVYFTKQKHALPPPFAISGYGTD
mgnify:CR=1 FL=1